jgi:chaperonin GroES
LCGDSLDDWHSPDPSANNARIYRHKNGIFEDFFQKSLLKQHFTKGDRNMAKANAKFRPLHDRVLVRRIEQDEKTKGGIIIPDTAKEKPMEGEILAVGNGHVNDNGDVRPLDVKKGDRVIFSKWAGTEITIDGEELMVMKESDIIGILAA